MTTLSKSAVLFSSIAVLSLSGCGEFNKGFEESWYKEAVAGCVAEAVKVGAPAAEAQAPCECVMNKLQDDLDGVTEKLNPPQEKMDKALKACDIPV